MWEEYELCRNLQYVSMEVGDGKGKGGTKIITFLYPTGFTQLPFAGGVTDQPYYYIRVFRAFLLGERQGTFRKMQKGNLPPVGK